MRLWQTIRTSTIDRHIHAEAYATLVLSGSYEEAGDQGRFQVACGDVLFHDRFEGHLDRFPASGAEVLNLRLAPHHSHSAGIARVADPDCVARVAAGSRRDAVNLLLSTATRLTPQPADWPDELASALLRNPSLKLSAWAEKNGLGPWTVSRGFAQVRNPCQYWQKQDGGMHVLAAAIYTGYKAALAQHPEPYQQWFVRAVNDGQLRGSRLQQTVQSFFSAAGCR